MRLTYRGWAVLVVVGFAYAAAWVAGQRALNAVAAPLLAALAAGALLVYRAEEPTVTYGSVRSGYPGQTRTLSVDVAGGGLVTIRQSLPDGLAAAELDATVTPPHTFERTVTLAQRGIYRLDSPTVFQQGPLGLVGRHVVADVEVSLLVYPRVYEVDESVVGRLFADELAAERQEFDRLREYVPGDPLKNVHWKSSAKYDDFLVMEFSPTERTETVTIVADADEEGTDDMAAAAATLALGALDVGLGVELTLPEEHLPAGRGDAHRQNVLTVLAAAGPGSVSATVHGEADVSIHADGTETTVKLAETTDDFHALLGTTRERTGEVVA